MALRHAAQPPSRTRLYNISGLSLKAVFSPFTYLYYSLSLLNNVFGFPLTACINFALLVSFLDPFLVIYAAPRIVLPTNGRKTVSAPPKRVFTRVPNARPRNPQTIFNE